MPNWKRFIVKAGAKDGKKTGYRDSVGLFIPLPSALACQFPSLAPKDNSPSHVTFLYIGNLPEEHDQKFLEIVNRVFSEKQPIVKASLDGIDYFQHPDKNRTVAHVPIRYSQSMAEIRDRLRNVLEAEGIEVEDSFPIYRPHTTLGYIEGLGEKWKNHVPSGSWEFDTIEVWGLPEVHKVKFTPDKSLVAGVRAFDSAMIERHRKEFLKIMKNSKVVKTFAQAKQWKKVLRDWSEGLYEFINRDLQKAFEQPGNEHLRGWVRDLRGALGPLKSSTLIPELDFDEDNFWKFEKNRKKWETRIKRQARDFWKRLGDFVTAYEKGGTGAFKFNIDEEERVNLEGFNTIVYGYGTNPEMDPQLMQKMKAILRAYRKAASKTFPLLISRQLPLYIDFADMSGSAGAQWRNGRDIQVFATALWNESIKGGVHILAHEMGHEIWRRYLSKDARDFWGRAVTGSYGVLDLDKVLQKYGSERSFFENVRIMREDPVMYLQLQGLQHDDSLNLDGASPSDLRDYLADGGSPTVQVHGKPITGYARTNNEEAFCEAVGRLVGYGSSTVLPAVRKWLKVMLPTEIKVAASVLNPQTLLFNYLFSKGLV